MQVYWPYNVTLGYYYDLPLAGKRAEDFIERMNVCKGGRWELHSTEQYDKWYKDKGKHLEWLSLPSDKRSNY